jgi:peptide/nickel transport system substrate-binding protein
VVGGTGLGLAACAGPSAPTAPPTTAAPAAGSAPTTAPAVAPTTAPKYGGTIKAMTTTSERNLDPHKGDIFATTAIGLPICYSLLVKYKSGPELKPPSYVVGPDLAESWTQPDDLTYVFKLRPGVKWHNLKPVNGRELVADDVVFSYLRILELKTFASSLQGVTRIEAVDKGTVKLALDKPSADLLGDLAFRTPVIAAREAVDANGDLVKGPTIGTGPFVFESFEEGQRFSAKRNPDYFLTGRPYLDGFESFRAADVSTLVNSFRAGSINLLGSGMNAQTGNDLLKALPKTNVVWIPVDRNPAEVGFKVTEELFNDVRVRRAISKGIDRRAMIETLFLGHAQLTTGLSFPAPDWYLPKDELERAMARDVEGAKQLLKEAGKSSGISFKLMTASNAAQGAYQSMSELFQANLRDIGIEVTLDSVDNSVASTRQVRGDFSAYLYAVSGSSPSGTLYTVHYTGGARNNTGYSNPALDKLIDQQAVLARDPDGRKRLMLEIQRTILADAAHIPLLYYESPAVTYPEIKGFYPPFSFSSHAGFWDDVWIDK